MLQATKQSATPSTGALFRLYKVVMIGILLVGTALDLALLSVGPGPLVNYVFTPLGELILTLWMATALVLGVMVYPHLDLHRRVTRTVQQILLAYFVLLVLMHGVNNLLLGNVAGYLAAFSAPAYPYIATAVLLSAAMFTAGLRQKPGAN